jgi:hypothetical protein
VESLHDPEHEQRVITADNVLHSFDAGLHPEAQHTGYYDNLDMMVMGLRGMTNSLDRTHMGLWAISSAPLTRASSARLGAKRKSCAGSRAHRRS